MTTSESKKERKMNLGYEIFVGVIIHSLHSEHCILL